MLHLAVSNRRSISSVNHLRCRSPTRMAGFNVAVYATSSKDQIFFASMHFLNRFRKTVSAKLCVSQEDRSCEESSEIIHNGEHLEPANLVRPTIDDMNFFAIRGFMRSGTNWANNLLNLHPHIASFGELHLNSTRLAMDQWLSEVWSPPARLGISDQVIQHFENFARQTMLECVLADRELNDKPFQWIGDRSPKPLDELVIGNAPQFRLVRDGRDILVSWTLLIFARRELEMLGNHKAMIEKYNRFQQDSNFFLNHPHELLDDESWVKKIARQWSSRALRDENFIRLAETGGTNCKVMSIRYEDLHADTDTIRKQMYIFLDLDPALALPLDSGRHKTSAGHMSEDPTSLYRKGVVGDWKKYFRADTTEWFGAIANERLASLGYSVNAN